MKLAYPALLLAAVASCTSALPSFPTKSCTSAGCTVDNTSLVLDFSYLVNTDAGYPAAGVGIDGDSLTLTLNGKDGPRVYLANSDQKTYKEFKLLGKEFVYDAESSSLGCSMNGALYFSAMPADGAAGGTNYCDAACVGGTCCAEFDLWEANRYATVFTSHPQVGSTYDKNGCAYNGYANNRHWLYGPNASYELDSTKPMTVITQFRTDTSGTLKEVRRYYKQNDKLVVGGSIIECANYGGLAQMGKNFANGAVLAMSVWTGSMDWLDANQMGPCPQPDPAGPHYVKFSNIYIADIGYTAPGTDMASTTAPVSYPPGTVGPLGACGGIGYSGPIQCQAGYKCTKQTEYYYRCEADGSPTVTTPASSTPATTTTATTTTTPAITSTTKPVTTAPGTATKWGQCGGNGWSGPTTCEAGTKCVKLNDWYWQCQ